MNFKEIFLSEEEKQKTLASLPDTLPFGEMIKNNTDNSVKISFVFTTKEASSKAEIHDNFNDLFLVQSGEEEFWVGGEITDKEETEKGEWLGGNLIGAQKYQLRAGDILVVPRGVPHKHGLGLATFLVIKTS